MVLSESQGKAALKIKEWFTAKKSPYFLLAGYAGTGKSTIASVIAKDLAKNPAYLTYTGKAAQVLRNKGGCNATTIHKMIYLPKGAKTAELKELKQQLAMEQDALVKKELHEQIRLLSKPSFSLNPASDIRNHDIVIIDEYSQVSEKIGKDLLLFNVPILALGDIGQLPPPYGKPFFTRQPDVTLTEIHRQAQDSPILQLATMARRGERIPIGEYGNCLVLKRGGNTEHVLSADQLLVGMNKTRTASNKFFRKNKNIDSYWPVDGDKLICLKNNHEAGLLNGSTWSAIGESEYLKEFDACSISLRSEDDPDREISVLASSHGFFANSKEIPPFVEEELFDYGYAITVHKAQGSQWGSVAILDEWMFKEREKWLYTAITRAVDKVVIIKQ